MRLAQSDRDDLTILGADRRWLPLVAGLSKLLGRAGPEVSVAAALRVGKPLDSCTSPGGLSSFADWLLCANIDWLVASRVLSAPVGSGEQGRLGAVLQLVFSSAHGGPAGPGSPLPRLEPVMAAIGAALEQLEREVALADKADAYASVRQDGRTCPALPCPLPFPWGRSNSAPPCPCSCCRHKSPASSRSERGWAAPGNRVLPLRDLKYTHSSA